MRRLDDDLRVVEHALRVGPEAALSVLEQILDRREKQRDMLLDRFTQQQQELKGLRKLIPEIKKKLNNGNHQIKND